MLSCHFSRAKHYIELNWSILFNLVITTLMECRPVSWEQETTNQDKIFLDFQQIIKADSENGVATNLWLLMAIFSGISKIGSSTLQ